MCIKRKARVLSAKKKIARNHREGTLASVFLLLLSCACVTPIDATAAGMNLKQFNFYSTPTRENCPLVEISTRKKTGHLPFKGEKEKKRVRERKKRGGYLTQVVQTKMFFFLCPRKSATKFSRERQLYSWTP